MEKLKQFSVIYPGSQIFPSWLLDALDSALFYCQLVKCLLVVILHIFPCWRNAVLTSHLDHCSPAGKKTERSRDRKTHGCLSLRKERRAPVHRAKWKEAAQKRKEMKSDVALSEFLQTPPIPVTECLWRGKGETLNEVPKAPGSLHHPLGCQFTMMLSFSCRENKILSFSTRIETKRAFSITWSSRNWGI